MRSSLSTSLNVFAFGTAIEANPGGEWRPTELVFSTGPLINPPETRTAFLVTTGSTPLAVTQLNFENTSLGYRFEMLPQIELELMGVRIICGDAITACSGQTRLIAETNAGMIPLTVRVQP